MRSRAGQAPEIIGSVRRVVIVGPGAAGKTTLATQLAQITGVPAIELDALF